MAQMILIIARRVCVFVAIYASLLWSGVSCSELRHCAEERRMALVAGLDKVASGSGIWTIGVPSGDTIAIDDPGVEGQVPTVDLMLDLKTNAPSMITFTGPPAPNPADSIGYTTLAQIAVKNDTGQPLNGLLFSLQNVDQKLPLDLVPGNIEFGHTVNANYAYFSQPQPVDGETTTLFSPDNKQTTPT